MLFGKISKKPLLGSKAARYRTKSYDDRQQTFDRTGMNADLKCNVSDAEILTYIEPAEAEAKRSLMQLGITDGPWLINSTYAYLEP